MTQAEHPPDNIRSLSDADKEPLFRPAYNHAEKIHMHREILSLRG